MSCDFYIPSFNLSIQLQTPAVLTGGGNIIYNQVSADAVATFPVSLSLLRDIFQYSGNVCGELTRPALPDFFSGNSALNIYGGNIQVAMEHNIINAYTMGTLTQACLSRNIIGGSLYLNPSLAMLPTSYSYLNIPVAINGAVLAADSTITSISNGGGDAANPKGPQIINVLADQMLLKYDFTRYLSRCLFNTPYGVSLFVNQIDVFDDIDNKCVADLTNIDSILSSTAAWTRDVNDHCYYNDPSNISYNIVANMYRLHPERFTSRNQIGGTEYCHVPFQSGDTIRHVITVNPAATQTAEIGNTRSIAPRRYEIVWDVVDDSAGAAIEYGIVPPVFLPSTANTEIPM